MDSTKGKGGRGKVLRPWEKKSCSSYDRVRGGGEAQRVWEKKDFWAFYLGKKEEKQHRADAVMAGETCNATLYREKRASEKGGGGPRLWARCGFSFRTLKGGEGCSTGEENVDSKPQHHGRKKGDSNLCQLGRTSSLKGGAFAKRERVSPSALTLAGGLSCLTGVGRGQKTTM